MKRLVGVFLIVSLAVIGGRFSFIKMSESSWFELREIAVKTDIDLNHDKIAEASQLEIGESVFKQNYKAACNNLSRLAGVEDVYITRDLPGKINIELKPDSIELLISSGKLKGLTRKLKIIDLDSEKLVLSIVTGIGIGKKSSYAIKTKLSYALSIHHALNTISKNLSSRLSEIHFMKDDKVILYFNPLGAKAILNMANFRTALARLSIIDNKGLLGNSGSFDLTTGRIVIRNRT